MSASPAPNVTVADSTGAVTFNGSIYCFHAGSGGKQGMGGNGKLIYNVFDGKDWSADIQVPGAAAGWTPSALVYNNMLYCFYASPAMIQTLWYSKSVDGKTWDPPRQVNGTYISQSPSAVVYDGKISCFHQGKTDGSVLFSSVCDGSSWTSESLSNVAMGASPSAVVYNNQIYCFYLIQQQNSWSLGYEVFNGLYWLRTTTLALAGQCGPPGAVVFHDKIHCFFQGAKGNGSVWVTVLDRGTRSDDMVIRSIIIILNCLRANFAGYRY